MEPKILVLSHGNMCKEMIESAKLIGIDVSNMVALPMDEIININTYEKQIRKTLETFPKESLVLIDFVGGTPFNTLVRILIDYPNIYGVTGVNLPMIIESWSSMSTLSGKDLQEAVLEAGISGIVNVNRFLENI